MTEVKLETITPDNYLDVVRLKVSPSQEDLVADNLWSLAQAFVFDYASPFALYNEERPGTDVAAWATPAPGRS